MPPALTLPAPAKLNLMLHIVGRRSDGYHNLQTLFQLLNYGDELSFTRRADEAIRLTSNRPEMVGADNLVLKAANALIQYGYSGPGYDIHLNKRLPAGGGLGGGSSDAATTLVALNHLWQLSLNSAELAQIAVGIGADVPLFVEGNSAWAEGIGDRLTPVQLEPAWYVIVTPDIHINTTELFRHPELTRDTPVSTIRSALAGLGHNDFEPLARRLYPALDDAFLTLANTGQFKLSGSGSSLYTQTQSDMTAVQMLQQILTQKPGYTGFVAQGVNQSPLHRALADQA